MRILQIGSDRSRRGILYPESSASVRQRAYGVRFGHLDIIGFSRRADPATAYSMEPDTHVYPTHSWSPMFYGLDTLRILRRLPKPDVISTQDPFEVGLLGLLIARILRVPLHVQIHTDFLTPEYARQSLVHRMRVWCARYVVRRASRVRVVSTAVARTLREQYDVQIPITVLPIFVELQQFADARTPASLSDRFTRFKTKILVVARLEPEKNVALAIESFATVAPPDACLIIVGDGRERRMLEDLARSHNVSDRVFFEGEQASISYYSMVDLVLVTSHYEGYGLVIVEALASHKAVIATDVGIAREMGAIVADEQRFPHALAEWFKDGSRAMQLRDYPYKNFDEYVKAYCDDVSACIPEEKSLQ